LLPKQPYGLTAGFSESTAQSAIEELNAARVSLQQMQESASDLKTQLSTQSTRHAVELKPMQELRIGSAENADLELAMSNLQEQYDELVERLNFMTKEQMEADERDIALVVSPPR
jgi:predicted transcriptional regulator